MMLTRVLIVDDERMLRHALKRLLKSRCANILEASTVPEALLELAQGVDLVITDVHLPGGTGIDVARAAARSHPPVPVIAMSGEAANSEVLALERTGVTDVLSKPFRALTLLDAVDRQRARSGRRATFANATSQDYAPTP